MDTVLAHLTAPVVVRSVVDQPLLVGAAGVVVVLAILLVFVMVLRSGARREVGVGLDGRQEPYGQPRTRPSQPNPYGQMSSFGQGPYDSQDPAYRAWQPNDGRMPAVGQPSSAAWGGGYDNGSMAGSAQQQPPWGAPPAGSRRDEPGWGSSPQGGGWQDQRGWGAAPGGQAQSGWGQAEAPVASPPWLAPAENNNWGGAGGGANAQPYAQAGGQSQPFGQGFASEQGADVGFGQQGGAQYGGFAAGQGVGYSAGYEAPAPAAMGGGGWSAPAGPNSAASVASGAAPQAGPSDDRGVFGFGGDMPRASRSGGGPGASSSGASLVVRVGKEPGRVYEVGNDRTTIGRSRESDIFLEDLAVSRNHTSIVRDDHGRYILRDESSANGTLVNNEPVNGPVALQYGDTIKVGETIMTFSHR